jgi:hypothetical protein
MMSQSSILLPQDVLTDPIDPSIVYSRENTVAVAIKDDYCRDFIVRGFGRHNVVFDAYRNPLSLLELFLEVPAFFRVIEGAIYCQLEAEIIEQYRGKESVPLLLVYGNVRLFNHPSIIDAYASTPAGCKRLYEKARLRAKRMAKESV